MRFAAKALGGIFTVKSPLGEMLRVVASQFAESAGVGRVGTALGARGEKREILRLRSCVRPRFREGMHCLSTALHAPGRRISFALRPSESWFV